MHHITNLNPVKQFNRNEGLLTRNNGEAIPVARAEKERPIEHYRWLLGQDLLPVALQFS